jgi:hypothetical protein
VVAGLVRSHARFTAADLDTATHQAAHAVAAHLLHFRTTSASIDADTLPSPFAGLTCVEIEPADPRPLPLKVALAAQVVCAGPAAIGREPDGADRAALHDLWWYTKFDPEWLDAMREKTRKLVARPDFQGAVRELAGELLEHRTVDAATVARIVDAEARAAAGPSRNGGHPPVAARTWTSARDHRGGRRFAPEPPPIGALRATLRHFPDVPGTRRPGAASSRNACATTPLGLYNVPRLPDDLTCAAGEDRRAGGPGNPGRRRVDMKAIDRNTVQTVAAKLKNGASGAGTSPRSSGRRCSSTRCARSSGSSGDLGPLQQIGSAEIGPGR